MTAPSLSHVSSVLPLFAYSRSQILQFNLVAFGDGIDRHLFQRQCLFECHPSLPQVRQGILRVSANGVDTLLVLEAEGRIEVSRASRRMW